MTQVSGKLRARRGSIIRSLVGLCAFMIRCQYGHGASSSDSELVDSSALAACPGEYAFCLGSTACVGCAEILQGWATSAISLSTDDGDCDTFVVTVCRLVNDAGCDGSSPTLLDLAGCLVEAMFGCPDFSTCDNIDTADTSYATTIDSVVPTTAAPFTTAIATSAPSINNTPTPSVVEGIVDETLVPTMLDPLSTPAPTTIAVDETLAPTLKLSLPSPSINEPIEADTQRNVGHKRTAALTTATILSAVFPVVVSALFYA